MAEVKVDNNLMDMENEAIWMSKCCVPSFFYILDSSSFRFDVICEKRGPITIP